MGQGFVLHLMLVVAAVLQVLAAAVAVTLEPIGGVRRWWYLVSAALVIQAGRRLFQLSGEPSTGDVVAACVISVLLFAGVLGIRETFSRERQTRRKLAEEQGRAETYSHIADVAIVVLDANARVRSLNSTACEIIGSPERNILGKDWFKTFVAKDSRGEMRDQFMRLMASQLEDDAVVQYMVTDRKGREHPVVWHRRVLRDRTGRSVGVRSVGIDLTEQERLQGELAVHSLLLAHTTDSVVAYQPDGTIVYANETASNYRGRERDAIIGTNMRDLVPPAEQDAFEAYLDAAARGDHVTYETRATDSTGVVRPLEASARLVKLDGQDLIVDAARDITERREAEAAIRRLAYSDALTGLPNRVLLQDRARLAIARAQRAGDRIAVFFIDVDNLKDVNDDHGHLAGDELLRSLGQRIFSTMRDEDTLARIGGDEFVVIAGVENAEEAANLATRIQDAAATPLSIHGRPVSTSVSVGIALFPDDGSDLDALVGKADASMYRAKHAGRAYDAPRA